MLDDMVPPLSVVPAIMALVELAHDVPTLAAAQFGDGWRRGGIALRFANDRLMVEERVSGIGSISVGPNHSRKGWAEKYPLGCVGTTV